MRKKVQKMTCGLLATGLLGCGVSSEVAAHLPVAGPSEPTTAGERPAQAPGRPGGLRQAATPLVAVTTRRPSPRTTATPTEAAPTLAMSALNRRIQSGRIIDEAGEPLIGATVLLKGTTRGTSTDANGDYALPVPLGLNTFVVAYNGYQEEVAQSRDGQPLTVTLLPIPGLAPVAPEQPAPKAKTHGSKLHFGKVQR